MKILVTGSGSQAGSYPVRAEQLGAAIGATVTPKATDFRGVDIAVLVKRALPETIGAARGAGVPLVYDVVDAWPQPGGNGWPREFCLAWLRSHLALVRPAAIVSATEAMRDDIEEECDFAGPILALPHHARPRQVANPIRERVLRVGYEGSERHLGNWRPWLEMECGRRGWTFHVNPIWLADVDILVALRELTGYAPMNYKSNVKLANAQATGTPIVCATEAGYRETDNGGAVFADAREQVVEAFDLLETRAHRLWYSSLLLKAAPSLESIAARYRAWLEGLACSTASRS